MKPALWRFRDTEMCIAAMDGYTPPSADWTPLYAAPQPAAPVQPPQEPCHCDRNNIGEPGVSCGDCPTRDYKQPAEQEPYAYAVFFPHQRREELAHDLEELCDDMTNHEHEITPLYTHPQPKREQLSDEQIVSIANRDEFVLHGYLRAIPFARAIEAAIKEQT